MLTWNKEVSFFEKKNYKGLKNTNYNTKTTHSESFLTVLLCLPQKTMFEKQKFTKKVALVLLKSLPLRESRPALYRL